MEKRLSTESRYHRRKKSQFKLRLNTLQNESFQDYDSNDSIADENFLGLNSKTLKMISL